MENKNIKPELNAPEQPIPLPPTYSSPWLALWLHLIHHGSRKPPRPH